METLEALQRRIRNAEDLHSIVGTMKTLAAVSIRQYERAIEALVEYHRTTELGLQVILAGWAQEYMLNETSKGGRLGAIVVGSDQGMCGQFNDHVTNFAIEYLDGLNTLPEDREVVSIGMRAASRLEENGQYVDGVYTLPGSALGITPLVQRLLVIVDEWRREREVDQVFLFYNSLESNIAYRSTSLRLLPIVINQLSAEGSDRWSSRSLPVYTMDRERLLRALIRQHLFVLLFRVVAESLASENSSRLLTMQMAEKNIDERLTEFNKMYHELRQSTITSEILDIISGMEALSGSLGN
jgi:F-type H+-transporting ATPase subunit gamma